MLVYIYSGRVEKSFNAQAQQTPMAAETRKKACRCLCDNAAFDEPLHRCFRDTEPSNCRFDMK